MKMRIAALFIVVVASAGCGGSDGSDGSTVSCDYTTNGQHNICTDYAAANAAYLANAKQACTQQTGAQVGTIVTACSHEGSGGACQSDVGGILKQTIWYYDMSATDVMSLCADAKLTYVAP